MFIFPVDFFCLTFCILLNVKWIRRVDKVRLYRKIAAHKGEWGMVKAFFNFNVSNGVDDKIHAVIIDECVDGKFDILLNLVNGWILPDPTERTVCIVFTRNLGSSVSI